MAVAREQARIAAAREQARIAAANASTLIGKRARARLRALSAKANATTAQVDATVAKWAAEMVQKGEVDAADVGLSGASASVEQPEL